MLSYLRAVVTWQRGDLVSANEQMANAVKLTENLSRGNDIPSALLGGTCLLALAAWEKPQLERADLIIEAMQLLEPNKGKNPKIDQMLQLATNALGSLNETVSVLFVAEIDEMQQPAAKAGLRTGDILWQYGSWSFPDALRGERAQAFFAEVNRLSDQSVTIVVIRDGNPVNLVMPPLPTKLLGVQIQDRSIPISDYATIIRKVHPSKRYSHEAPAETGAPE